jgi:hypothetical protein
VSDQPFFDAIEGHFPYDGPHSADKVTDAAYGISALVRYLNNATRPGRKTLEWGATVHQVLGGIHATTASLDQLFRQLGEAAERLADDPTLYDDRRSDLHPGGKTALEVSSTLTEARSVLDGLVSKLDDAHSLSSHLGNN